MPLRLRLLESFPGERYLIINRIADKEESTDVCTGVKLSEKYIIVSKKIL